MPTVLLCLIFTSCVTLKSCNPDPPPPSPDPIPHVSVNIPAQIESIQDVRKAVETGVASIKTEASAIKSSTSSGRKDFPKAPQWDFIDKSANSIDQVSDAVDSKVKDLNKAGAELAVAEAERKRQEEFMAQSKRLLEEEQAKTSKLEEEIQSWKDGAKKRQTAIWMTISGFSALGLVVGIFLFIYAKSELGIALCISSLILACISYFMAAYALYVAIVGGVILLLVVIYLTYFLFINKKALTETVMSLEDVKHKDWDDPGVSEKVSKIQSYTTKKIVHDIKLDMGLK